MNGGPLASVYPEEKVQWDNSVRYCYLTSTSTSTIWYDIGLPVPLHIHSSAAALGQFLYPAPSAQMRRESRWKWFSRAPKVRAFQIFVNLKIATKVISNKETSDYSRNHQLTWIGRCNFKLRLIIWTLTNFSDKMMKNTWMLVIFTDTSHTQGLPAIALTPSSVPARAGPGRTGRTDVR